MSFQYQKHALSSLSSPVRNFVIKMLLANGKHCEGNRRASYVNGTFTRQLSSPYFNTTTGTSLPDRDIAFTVEAMNILTREYTENNGNEWHNQIRADATFRSRGRQALICKNQGKI